MFSVFRALVALGVLSSVPAERPALRVCADPNNMPFSNQRGEGFENKIATLVAHDMGRTVSYFWSPQRRGFVRNTPNANRCDVIMGVPSQFEPARPTRPYYRSSYVFVVRRDRGMRIQSFDDPRLTRMRIGIQLTGDDYDNPPAAQALAVRHIIQNVRGYTVYGDYATHDPQRDVIDAVADRAVDVAVVWGPLAGFFATHARVPMALTPVEPERDGPTRPFRFDISMGVRRTDDALRERLDRIIV